MPDHIHIITGGEREPSDTLRYLNGISAKRILDYLKEREYASSLAKLRQYEKKRGYKHSVWEHHGDTFLITNEATLIQKVNYIHQNPVRVGLTDHPDDYLHSSSRIWSQKALQDEPLTLDIDQIEWRAN